MIIEKKESLKIDLDKMPEEFKPMAMQAQRFLEVRNLYHAAIKEVSTKLEILDDEFHVNHDYNPIHHMECRVKSIKSIFDKMPHTIDILIITPQAVTTFSRWNDWMDAIFLEDSYQSITVIPFIRQKIFSSYPFNKSASLRTVCNGTCCNKHSDRHTMRIHGQVYL